MKQTLTLIAHRGYSASYPENTLIAYQAAYDFGARFVELDIQLSSDFVPILHHDLSLKRMTGIDSSICTTTSEQLTHYKASYPKAFGNKFSDNTFTTLKQFCQWLQQHCDVTTFIEIKQESIDHFGIEAVINAIYHEIDTSNVQAQAVVISYNKSIIEIMRKRHHLQIGWVLPALDKKASNSLEQLKPDFAFCDIDFLKNGDEKLWQGQWKWAIYNADDVKTVIAMANRGITLIETNEIGILIQDKKLAGLL